jgi:hypothetical protein
MAPPTNNERDVYAVEVSSLARQSAHLEQGECMVNMTGTSPYLRASNNVLTV